MTPFIFNLLMMENSLIKSPCLAKKELWELIYEMKSPCVLVYTSWLTGKAVRTFLNILIYV